MRSTVSDLADRTIVVVAADHGEGLGEHGEQTHGLLVYDSVLRVPLIVRAPASGRDGSPTSYGWSMSRRPCSISSVSIVLHRMAPAWWAH